MTGQFLYTDDEGNLQVVEAPSLPPYYCDLLGDGSFVFYPRQGIPNCFHRLMQRLCFGFIWRKNVPSNPR